MVRLAGGEHAALGTGHAEAILRTEDERAHGGNLSGHGIGAALYAAAWAGRHGAEAARWRRGRSAARRWMATNGNEWELLRGSRFTDAFHVARAWLAACEVVRGGAATKTDSSTRGGASGAGTQSWNGYGVLPDPDPRG
jgi:hypothetical protein